MKTILFILMAGMFISAHSQHSQNVIWTTTETYSSNSVSYNFGASTYLSTQITFKVRSSSLAYVEIKCLSKKIGNDALSKNNNDLFNVMRRVPDVVDTCLSYVVISYKYSYNDEIFLNWCRTYGTLMIGDEQNGYVVYHHLKLIRNGE